MAMPDSLSKGNIIDLADYLKGCAVTLFLPQSKPNLLEKPRPLKHLSEDIVAESCWRGACSTWATSLASSIVQGNDQVKKTDEEGETDEHDRGTDIVDHVSASGGDSNTKDSGASQSAGMGSSSSKGCNEAQKNGDVSGGGAEGSAGAGGSGEDGRKQNDKVVGEDDIPGLENSDGDDDKDNNALDANPEAAGHEEVEEVVAEVEEAVAVEQKKRKVGENNGGEGQNKCRKKSEPKPQEVEPVLCHSGRSSQKDKNTAPKEE
ncbi:uncharacterized protein EV420DRAFT_1483397 [Desarmillaria tabescens]|uniref:Uncharacterized protein n=1 Tax=Armillaria tabescens TaxID=1929756 RepID=A0AA39JUF2_ARMTA|nr:uncharacterized protein EV420DRAFT_1483397 [Desarmillaria tabescens]KAK0448988.1 hypothetical protein EV420DRAFT_1483397 [Desarmillaria tabescens]